MKCSAEGETRFDGRSGLVGKALRRIHRPGVVGEPRGSARERWDLRFDKLSELGVVRCFETLGLLRCGRARFQGLDDGGLRLDRLSELRCGDLLRDAQWPRVCWPVSRCSSWGSMAVTVRSRSWSRALDKLGTSGCGRLSEFNERVTRLALRQAQRAQRWRHPSIRPACCGWCGTRQRQRSCDETYASTGSANSEEVTPSKLSSGGGEATTARFTELAGPSDELSGLRGGGLSRDARRGEGYALRWRLLQAQRAGIATCASTNSAKSGDRDLDKLSELRG